MYMFPFVYYLIFQSDMLPFKFSS